MTEIVVILVIALLIFGPNKLPELARSLGRGFGEFRRASYDLRQSLMDAAEEPPPRPPARSDETIHRAERGQPEPGPTTPPKADDPGNPQGGA